MFRSCMSKLCCFNERPRRRHIVQQTVEAQVEVPDSLCDPILMTPFTDPVITPYGSVYERSEILQHLSLYRTDPLTTLPLTQDDLKYAPEVSRIVNEFQALRSDTINEISGSLAIRQNELISSYQNRLTALGLEMSTSLQGLREQYSIQLMKDRLKIDTRKPDHMMYWLSKGTTVRRIPKVVLACMTAAETPYANLNDFVTAVNTARNAQINQQLINRKSKIPSFFINLKKAKETKEFQKGDLKTLRFS